MLPPAMNGSSVLCTTTVLEDASISTVLNFTLFKYIILSVAAICQRRRI